MNDTQGFNMVTMAGTYGPPEFFHLVPWKDATDPKGIDTGKEYLVRWPDGRVRQGEWYPFWRMWIDQMGDSFDVQPRWYVAMVDLPGPTANAERGEGREGKGDKT